MRKKELKTHSDGNITLKHNSEACLSLQTALHLPKQLYMTNECSQKAARLDTNYVASPPSARLPAAHARATCFMRRRSPGRPSPPPRSPLAGWRAWRPLPPLGRRSICSTARGRRETAAVTYMVWRASRLPHAAGQFRKRQGGPIERGFASKLKPVFTAADTVVDATHRVVRGGGERKVHFNKTKNKRRVVVDSERCSETK